MCFMILRRTETFQDEIALKTNERIYLKLWENILKPAGVKRDRLSLSSPISDFSLSWALNAKGSWF